MTAISWEAVKLDCGNESDPVFLGMDSILRKNLVDRIYRIDRIFLFLSVSWHAAP
jgi:hypothetical protein